MERVEDFKGLEGGSGADGESGMVEVDSGSQLFFDNLVWMTSIEAARFLRKTPGALYVMVCRGYIKPVKFKRRLYFRRNDLNRLLENSSS